MRIGIIETGRPPAELAERHGDYPAMFRRLLSGISPTPEFATYAAIDGEVPSDPHAADAWLITGSRHGVYERLEWMQRLAEFVRAVVDARVPLVGICFGHQIIADALGGEVVKSDRGWGVGVQRYEVTDVPEWAEEVLRPGESLAVHAVHQDQVVRLPEGANVIASSPFCPYAALTYGDGVLTVQPHPEMEEPFMRDLIHVRLSGVVPPEVGSAALASLGVAIDSDRFAAMIEAFLRSALERRAARAA
ncbi:MAG: type 1 glutamine amidotransferase [Rhizobiales bacterium]|nr:type 1 glutamine amidotransferase [Hyphomicrobiales bacterium]